MPKLLPISALHFWAFAFLAAAATTTTVVQVVVAATVPSSPSVLVVGSANADTFLPVERLPTEGENLTLIPNSEPIVDVAGGKGVTQAVAVSKILSSTSTSTSTSTPKTLFIGQLGLDHAGKMLHQTLDMAGVICSQCGFHSDISSGRGYVFLQKQTGSVSAVVSGGTNMMGWKGWEKAWEEKQKIRQSATTAKTLDEEHIRCVLLQREVPEYVNLLIASCVEDYNNQCDDDNNKIVVFQDVGGEDRPISKEMLELCDYIVPNESELKRLVESSSPSTSSTLFTNVLVTRGSSGSMLLAKDGTVTFQSAIRCDNDAVVDETGAGDCFRAAFAVAYIIEGWDLKRSLLFASAAGSCSVEKNGAVPSTPDRDEVSASSTSTSSRHPTFVSRVSDNMLRGGGEDAFPFLIGSRLNSMKDRPDLWRGNSSSSPPLETPRDYVQRQATIRGLTCVDFNFPQHFGSFWTPPEAKKALNEVGLVAGAVCLRYPAKFARGAMNHPDYELRREAIELTKEAAEAANELGCDEVVIWSAFDGYDYPFQVDYDEKWDQLVSAFQELCDSYPNIKFSLEYKPTDENTRFFTVPTTGAALLLVEEIDRSNMGLTLDVGHMLMAGENPGQSIAMVGRKRKLFGIQLNDGFTRLAAEDGLMFGSVHPSMALEIMYQLHKTEFKGHLYFDTFPQRSDPVKEAEYNIRQVKRFWNAAKYDIDDSLLRQITNEHDAIGALELVDKALRYVR
ncbi:putative ribokinase [Fragilariopsis cylindrus CCMP1102]|uniref:Putative ribokinase n=1 Tax=Fragilariopsis cylindrus CCMP1102 TaxID=635003 RepID=A0A1E7ET48_9STRA|nr:putative ribokinase [Fragilariopsis cylindrus CCMP1102]|eukprot:OEU08974.1 putative ribokinase [Fragilariopsis cylindrus CCMP1102]